MLSWFAENLPTILVLVVLVTVVALIIVHMVRNRRKGKLSCGCGCQNCPMSGSCHQKMCIRDRSMVPAIQKSRPTT